jgi:hypothetical protein
VSDDGGGSSNLCTCKGVDTGRHENWCPAPADRVFRCDNPEGQP